MNAAEINRLLADRATERIIELLTGGGARPDRRTFLAHCETVGKAAAARRVVLERVGVLGRPGLRLAILTSWVETMCALIDWDRVGEEVRWKALEDGPPVSPG